MNKQVKEIGQINLRGNIFDHGWFEYLKLENGKPNMIAITILGEIVYWYKPTEERDEETNEVIYKQKFKADMLQKSYQQLADSFGFTKRQVKDACDYLKEKNLLHIEFRTIMVNGVPHNNVMYVEPISENVRIISKLYHPDTPVTLERRRVVRSNVTGSYDKTEQAPTIERKTNTKSTTDISTESYTDLSSSSESGEKEAVQGILSFWDNNGFGFNNMNAKDQLLKYLDEGFDPEVILKALNIASEVDKRNLQYIKGILHRWENAGAKNIQQVNAYMEQYKLNNQKGGKTNERTKPSDNKPNGQTASKYSL
jgi:DnaD/phage-associated family protein